MSSTTNGKTAEDLLNKAAAATKKQEPIQPKRPNKPQKETEIVKASSQTEQAGAEAITKFNQTQKQIEALETKSALENGRRAARRMSQAEDIGFIDEMTKQRARSAKSRVQGLQLIEQKVDAELGASEQFKSILEGANDEDPLEMINEVLAASPSIEMSDPFSLLGSISD